MAKRLILIRIGDFVVNQFYYDKNGRLLRVFHRDELLYNIEYNSFGYIDKFECFNYNNQILQNKYLYDKNGIYKKYSNGKLVEIEKDIHGNIIHDKYSHGEECKYTYDDQNRLLKAISLTTGVNVAYTYNEIGMTAKLASDTNIYCEIIYDISTRRILTEKEYINGKISAICNYNYENTNPYPIGCTIFLLDFDIDMEYQFEYEDFPDAEEQLPVKYTDIELKELQQLILI